MKTSEFDEKFDNSENILSELDMTNVRRSGEETKRININLPVWMIVSLEREAIRLGITRQDLIKMWLAERIQHL